VDGHFEGEHKGSNTQFAGNLCLLSELRDPDSSISIHLTALLDRNRAAGGGCFKTMESSKFLALVPRTVAMKSPAEGALPLLRQK